MTDYDDSAKSDAEDMARNFRDEIAAFLRDGNDVSDDYNNDYPDGDAYHHENHVDKEYDLSEAAELLSELSDYEETDSGLWDGLPPARAIACQAAYTYGNAVTHHWRQIIEAINDSDMATAIKTLADGGIDSKDLESVANLVVSSIISDY